MGYSTYMKKIIVLIIGSIVVLIGLVVTHVIPVSVPVTVPGLPESVEPDLLVGDWRLQQVTSAGYTVTLPPEFGAFTVSFVSDGTFVAATDCNEVHGQYAVAGDTIAFTDMQTVKKTCDDSATGTISAITASGAAYAFDDAGNLVLSDPENDGGLIFSLVQ